MTARGDCSARFFKVYFHYINLQRGDGQGLQEYISGVLLELREFGGAEGLDKNSGKDFGSIRKWETRILS
jgi:hypothetical protein